MTISNSTMPRRYRAAFRTAFATAFVAAASVAAAPDGLAELAQRVGAPLAITHADKRTDPAEIRGLLRDSLSLDDAIRIAACNNRDIQAALSELSAAAAERRGGRLPPNPDLEADIRWESGGSGERRADYAAMLDLSGLIFYPLQWSASGGAYRSACMRTVADLRGRIAQVKAGYYRVQALEEIHSLLASMRENADAADELSRRQRKAGNIGSLERSMQQGLQQDAALALTANESEITAAEFELAALLGIGASDAPILVKVSLPEIPAGEGSQEDLMRMSRAMNPDIAAAREAAGALEQAASMAAWNRLPALRAGVAFEQEGSRSFLGPKLGLEIPLDLGWNAAAKAKASSEAAAQRLAASEDKGAAAVKAGMAMLAAARKTAYYYRDEVIPLRQEVVAETQKQYNFGLAGVYQLLQAKQSEYLARRGYIEAQRAYWIAHVELERVLGAPLMEVNASQDQSGGAR